MRELLAAAALLVASPTLLPATPVQSAASITGLWDAVVVTSDAEVPFRFEISTSGTDAQGFFFEGDRKIGSSSGTFAGRRAETRIRPPEHDARGQTGRRRSGRHVPEQSAELEAAADPHAPLHTRRLRWPGRAVARRHVGNAARGRRSVGASGYANVERVSAPVGRRGERHDSARGRRHRHARRPLAGRQTGAQPLRRRAAESVRSDAQRRTARLPSRSTGRRTTSSSARARRARKGIPEPPDPSRYTSVKDPTTPFQFSFPGSDGPDRLGDRRADSAARS